MSGNRRGIIASAPTNPAVGQIMLGTRVNYGNTGNAAQAAISGWGANPVHSVLMEYLNNASAWGVWGASGSPNVWNAVGGFSPGFTGWPGPKMISVPVQVTGTPLTWTDVTGGGQDSNFTSFFTWCHTNGVQHLRPGWEGNLASTTWPWGTLGNDTSGNQAGYVGVWQHIWNLAHAVAPGYFTWWWCPSSPQGGPSFANYAPGGAYYPGDSYVDVIGVDLYNTWAGSGSWPGDSTFWTDVTTGATPNLGQILTYANAHNKAICFPELGMNGNNALPNGGDDPTFIDNAYDWAATAASDGRTVYFMPWDTTGVFPISGFPNSLAELKVDVAAGVAAGLIAPPASTLTIGAVSTQAGTVGSVYGGHTLTAAGGVTPYAFSATSGLPSGLAVASSTGVISGTPTTANTYTTDVQVQDAATNIAPTSFQFNIAPSGAIVPAYSPPGGVGALLFNSDFSTLSNASGSAGPMWASTTGSTNNGMTASPANVSIVGGQLVLTLASTSSGAQISTDNQGTYPTPSDGGFSHTYMYVEASLVMPAGGWWAFWLSGDPWPTKGEFDIAENLGAGPSTNYHGTSSSDVFNGGAWGTQPSVGSTFVAGGLWKPGVVTSYNNGALQKTITSGQGGVTIGPGPEFLLLTMGHNSGTGYQLKANYVRAWAVS